MDAKKTDFKLGKTHKCTSEEVKVEENLDWLLTTCNLQQLHTCSVGYECYVMPSLTTVILEIRAKQEKKKHSRTALVAYSYNIITRHHPMDDCYVPFMVNLYENHIFMDLLEDCQTFVCYFVVVPFHFHSNNLAILSSC